MSLDVFKAYTQGYSDSLFDQQILSIQTGYWAAYYTNSKHPKPLKTIITELSSKRLRAEQRQKKNIVRPEVDVDAFLATEEQFLRRLQSK